jgi:hypothetical protein
VAESEKFPDWMDVTVAAFKVVAARISVAKSPSARTNLRQLQSIVHSPPRDVSPNQGGEDVCVVNQKVREW